MSLINRIKEFEGLSLKPYYCPTGKLTIGYGHNIEDNGISYEIAQAILLEDIEIATKTAMSWLGNPGIWDSLSQLRKDVLIDMAFNLGANRLGTFKRFRQSLLNYDFEQASKEMLNSKWANQVKGRALILASEMLYDKPYSR